MNSKFYAFVVSIAIVSLAAIDASAQGCVAVKNMTTCPLTFDSLSSGRGLQLSVNYRYFRSYKHFTGSHEETHRVEDGTEVINNDNSFNFAATYSMSRRFSASVIIPYVNIDRSSMYEHLGNSSGQRFHTQSQGLGDIRVIGYYNAIPANKVALTLGVGFKLPTGDYQAKDEFQKADGRKTLYVDQSIQPGDGGFGQIVEADFSIAPRSKWGAYVNAMYMFNPRNTNGIKRNSNGLVKTQSGEDIARSDEFSVADQYLIRAGARFQTHRIQAMLGYRMECIPSKDLIGKSEGFRRPGYIMSAEPSVFYTFGRNTIGINFPIALERNRTRSQIDIMRGEREVTKPDGSKVMEPFHGDAAFADWLLSLSYSYRIPM